MFSNETILIIIIAIIFAIIFLSPKDKESLSSVAEAESTVPYTGIPPVKVPGLNPQTVQNSLVIDKIYSTVGGFLDVTLQDNPRGAPTIPSLKRKLKDYDTKLVAYDEKMDNYGRIINAENDVDGNLVSNIKVTGNVEGTRGIFNDVMLMEGENQTSLKTTLQDLKNNTNSTNSNIIVGSIKTEKLGSNNFLFVDSFDNGTLNASIQGANYPADSTVVPQSSTSNVVNKKNYACEAEAEAYSALCPNGYYQVGLSVNCDKVYPVCKKLN